MRTMILAGGLATRMPFKPLLAVDSGRCALQKLYEDLESMMFRPEVVVREGSPVHAFCKINCYPVLFQTEPMLAGALHACVRGEEPAMIFLADNVYPWPLINVGMTPNSACVADCQIPGLAHWDGERWHRDDSLGPSCRALISPWCLSAKTLRTARWDQAHLIFQDAGVRPLFVESRGWHDIGTEVGYRGLWDAAS